MDKDWLKRKLTIEEAEAENLVADSRLGPTPIPFGFCYYEWESLIAEMQPGDELWEFSSSRESWKHLCGRSGIALVRGGEIVQMMITEMN
jgi:hypothetical protein